MTLYCPAPGTAFQVSTLGDATEGDAFEEPTEFDVIVFTNDPPFCTTDMLAVMGETAPTRLKVLVVTLPTTQVCPE